MGTERDGLRDTDADWRAVAEENPYWGVLSADQYKGKELPPAEFQNFYKSGEGFVQNLFGFIRNHIVRDFAPQRSLDFGCGVGRLLAPLARLSNEAVGVDVAENMLKIAKRNLESMGIRNVKYALSDDTLSRAEGEFDLVNTYIVLQHIPPQRGYRILRALLSKLRKGGCASIQLTYGKDRQFFQHEAARAGAYRRDGNFIIDLLPRDDTVPSGRITMFDYDLNQIMAQIAPIAGHPVMMLPTFDDRHYGVHLVFAKVRDSAKG